MKNNNLFVFNQKQRNGILILIVILLSLHIYNGLLSPMINDLGTTKSLSDILLEKDIKIPDTISIHEIIKLEDNKELKLTHSPANKPATLINFDPNKVDSLTLYNFGLHQNVINNLLKYRSKGGYFKKCEDLNKIYGIDSMLYKKMEPYCECSNIKKKVDLFDASTYYSEIININIADTTDLKKLKGIGSKLANRIIKYRNNIGGFHTPAQLLEVYGIEKEVLELNSDRIIIDGIVNQLDINSSQFMDLYRHFYFDKSISNAIVKYRKQHGQYDSIQQIKNIKIIPDSLYIKIAPYMTVKPLSK